MYEVFCYDVNGNSINYLTQWDVNQKIYVSMDGYELSGSPEVHFCNKLSETALIVTSSISGSSVVTTVPNTLLQESYPIIGHIYLESSSDKTSKKTVLTFTIPVRARTKPGDYYIESTNDDFFNELVNRVYNELLKKVDTSLSTTSSNPVQNKVVAKKFNDLENKINNL